MPTEGLAPIPERENSLRPKHKFEASVGPLANEIGNNASMDTPPTPAWNFDDIGVWEKRVAEERVQRWLAEILAAHVVGAPSSSTGGEHVRSCDHAEGLARRL